MVAVPVMVVAAMVTVEATMAAAVARAATETATVAAGQAARQPNRTMVMVQAQKNVTHCVRLFPGPELWGMLRINQALSAAARWTREMRACNIWARPQYQRCHRRPLGPIPSSTLNHHVSTLACLRA